MQLINTLERRFGKIGIPNLTYYLIAGQVVTYLLAYASPSYRDLLTLQGNMVLQGQLWRLVTFLFVPFSENPFFILFAWFMYYLFGSTLEQEWGTFRYNLYILIGIATTLLTASLFPLQTLTNGYLFASIFLAFAYLNPEYRLLIFFIIPVKVKWLAILTWIALVASILSGTLETKTLVVLSLVNFFLFFGESIYAAITLRRKHIAYEAKSIVESQKSFMECAVCHATEMDNKAFYDCDECKLVNTYCEDHIYDHTHKA